MTAPVVKPHREPESPHRCAVCQKPIDARFDERYLGVWYCRHHASVARAKSR